MLNCFSMTTRWEFGHKLDNQTYIRVGDKAQRECQWRRVCFRDTPQYERQWRHPCLRGTARCTHLQPHPLSVVRILSGRLSCLHLHTHGEQFFTSVLVRDTLEAISLTIVTGQCNYSAWNIPLHLPHRMRSIFILLSTMDWYLEVKIWAEDSQYSSCPLIQETKITKILNILTSLYHVERDTCTVHGRGIKTRCSGSILILRSKKD